VYTLHLTLSNGATHVAVIHTLEGRRFVYGESHAKAQSRARFLAESHPDFADRDERAGLVRETFPIHAGTGSSDVQRSLQGEISDHALSILAARVLQQHGRLRSSFAKRGWCFALSSKAALNGIGAMVLGIRQDPTGEAYWHAVVQLPNGVIDDPTLEQSFQPGVYEALGFTAHETLSPLEVQHFMADHGHAFPFPAPHNLGLADLGTSREAAE
jgi:hypothetical protein